MADSEGFADYLARALDPGRLRYGMPTSDKEALAASGALPGSPYDPSADQDKSNRYASGYLFAQNWPSLAPKIQPFIDAIKTSDLPLIGGSTPELQSYATTGIQRALLERQRQPSFAAHSALAQAAALRGR